MNNDLEQFSEERLKDMQKHVTAGMTLGHADALLICQAIDIALAAKQAKPVAQVYQPANIGICAALGPAIRMINVGLPAGTLLYTTPQPAHTEQDGWKLVPIEPTDEMKKAGGHVNSEWLNDNAPIGETRYSMPMHGVYGAMLAAAPKPESE